MPGTPSVESSTSLPRFVLLRHELPAASNRALHWDLMLERENVLRTWALEEEPSVGMSIRATELADHRLAYLDYEGPVSGNRGKVSRCERGTYKVLRWEMDVVEAILISLRGRIYLTAIRSQQDQWQMEFGLASQSISH
ncbi:MAG: hypothetical protein MK179_10480 [Pirellulaceae bacterium]|nr:hypothetical protein [Pirellulaceae bacterium]